MAVEASDKPNLPDNFDDEPLVFKRYTSKKSQLNSEVRKSTSQSHDGPSYRQNSDGPSSNGKTSSMQKGNIVPSAKASAPVKASAGISKAPNSLGNSSSAKLPLANSKLVSSRDKPKTLSEQKMSINVKEEKNIKNCTKDEDSEDDDDHKPLSARLKVNSHHDNKTSPVVVKKSSEDSEDDDDDIPLSVKINRNSNLATSSSNNDDSDKKPISKVQKERQNGSGITIKQERASTLPVKRPIDNSNSLNSSMKKPKVSDSAASTKAKQVSGKSQPKIEDDDDDDVPISQRIKNSAKSAAKSVSIKKTVTKATKVNKSGTTSFKKQAKFKSKKSGSGSEYSKASKLLPSSGDGQKKWTTLVHNGVIFPPPYQPHRVKMLYKGKPVDLTADQEEVRFYLCKLCSYSFC